MRWVQSAAGVRSVDRQLIDTIGIPSVVLMDHAGRAVAEAARHERSEAHLGVVARNVGESRGKAARARVVGRPGRHGHRYTRRKGRRAAAAESPRSAAEVPYARAPAPMRQRKSPLGLIIVLLALEAIAAGIWYFFLR